MILIYQFFFSYLKIPEQASVGFLRFKGNLKEINLISAIH